jgi:hypothetical protein
LKRLEVIPQRLGSKRGLALRRLGAEDFEKESPELERQVGFLLAPEGSKNPHPFVLGEPKSGSARRLAVKGEPSAKKASIPGSGCCTATSSDTSGSIGVGPSYKR